MILLIPHISFLAKNKYISMWGMALLAPISLLVAVLLCVIFWLGRLWNSEWLWSGGIITVVIIAIGGPWFIHWFIHRYDP